MKCNYRWSEASHFHPVVCGLDKNHKGDHAFFYRFSPRDIKHDHDWVKVERPPFDYDRAEERDYRRERMADAEYRCSFCGAKRLEYY